MLKKNLTLKLSDVVYSVYSSNKCCICSALKVKMPTIVDQDPHCFFSWLVNTRSSLNS